MLATRARSEIQSHSSSAPTPVITPRRTRLIRVADLHAFRRVVANLSTRQRPVRNRLPARPLAAGRRPDARRRAAARSHHRTRRAGSGPSDFATREQLYDRFCARLPGPPPRRLTHVRAGGHDEGGRRGGRRRRGAAVSAAAGPGGRGGALLRSAAASGAERRAIRESARPENLARDTDPIAAPSGCCGRRIFWRPRSCARAPPRRARIHGRACAARTSHPTAAPDPIRHLIVSVADWIADPNGLYSVDFDLATRLPGLEAIDLVATEELLASGFHQRVHDWFPGIEEVDERAVGAAARRAGVPIAPVGSGAAPFVLSAIAKKSWLLSRAARAGSPPGSIARRSCSNARCRICISREVFGGAGIPYQTFDALPLAAEPFAAALDVVIEFVSSQFTRDASVALLRSPHFEWATPGNVPGTRLRDSAGYLSALSALDRGLSEARYLGELDRLRALAEHWTGDDAALPALRAVVDAAGALQPLLERAPASVQLARLASFLASHARAVTRSATRRSRPPAPRARGRRRHSRIARRRARRARRSGRDDRRARARHPPLDRGRNVRARLRRRRDPAARRPGGALRRFRRSGDRRPDRRRMAGAAAAQHFLSARPARLARVAVREGSARRGDRRLCRSRAVAGATGRAVDVHAGRRSARRAVVARRRPRPRAAGGRRNRAAASRPRLRRGAVARSAGDRRARGRGRRLGVDAAGAHRRHRAGLSRPGWRAAPAAARSAPSRRTSRARSSSSRSTSSASTTSPTTTR